MADSLLGEQRYARSFAVVLVLLLLVFVVVRWRMQPVEPQGADAPAAEFSATRAFEALSTVLGDQTPHPVDSAAADGVRQRIVVELERLGYHPEIQEATSCRRYRYSVCAKVRNVIAVHPGSVEGQAILLSAHYDSVAAGPGASDAGSAVAALLEIARLLKNKPEAKNSVVLLFNEGEEAGLLGAQAFIAHHPLASTIAAAINIEARGTSGQSVMFETGDSSGGLVQAFASTSKRPLTNSLLYEAYKLMPNDTDLTVFKANGIQGLNFAHGERSHYYHTPLDRLENLHLGSVQQHGDNAYGMVEALLDADLSAVGNSGNRVYTDVLGFGVVHWPISMAVAIAGGLFVMFVVAAWVLHKSHRYGIGSVIMGFLSVPLAVVVSGVVAYAAAVAMSLFHDGMTPWHSSVLGNQLFLWGAVLLSVLMLQKLLARRSDPLGFWVGVCIPWLSLAVLSSLALPGTSYLFVLPSMVMVGIAWLLVVLAKRTGSNPFPALFAVPAVMAFVVLTPAIYLVEIMLGFNALAGAIGMSVLLGLAATSIGPLSRAGTGARARQFAVYGLLALTLIGGVMSVRAPAFTAEQPQPLNVIYVQDNAGKSHVLAGTQHQSLPADVRAAMGDATSLDARLPWTTIRQYNAPMDSLGLQPAGLTVLGDEIVGGERTVIARIDAGPDSYKWMLLIPKPAELSMIEIDGQPVDYANAPLALPDYHIFVCQGLSCEGKQITLRFREKSPQLAIVARVTSGLPAQVEQIAGSRGTRAVSYGDGDQTVVLASVSL